MGKFRKFIDSLKEDFWPYVADKVIESELLSVFVLLILFILVLLFDKKSVKKAKNLFNVIFCALCVGIMLCFNIFVRSNFWLKAICSKIMLFKSINYFIYIWVFILCGAYVGFLFTFIDDFFYFLAPDWLAKDWRLSLAVNRVFIFLVVYYLYRVIEFLVKTKKQKQTVILRIIAFLPVLLVGIIIRSIGATILLGVSWSFVRRAESMYIKYTFKIWVTILINLVLFPILYYSSHFVHLNYFKKHFSYVNDSIVKEKQKAIIKT